MDVAEGNDVRRAAGKTSANGGTFTFTTGGFSGFVLPLGSSSGSLDASLSSPLAGNDTTDCLARWLFLLLNTEGDTPLGRFTGGATNIVII